MSRPKTKIPINYQQVINDAWLGIHVKEDTLFNPLAYIPIEYEDNPHMYILWLMQQPEYFYFLCNEIFNIQLLPFQSLILKEMWDRKFPMLIACRGGGKSFMLALYSLLRILLLPTRKVVIVGAAFRQSKVIFNYMETIWNNAPLLKDLCGHSAGPRHEPDMFRFHIGDSVALALPIGDGCLSPYTTITYDDGFGYIVDYTQHNNYIWGDGNFNYSDQAVNNGIKKVSKIICNTGINISATNNHKFKVLDNLDIVWKRVDEIKIGDFILIDRSYRWHNGNFECTEDQAYSLGAMIGDGCWTNDQYLRFATKDVEIINKLNNGITKFKQCADKIHFNCKANMIDKWLDFWKLKHKCYTKDKTLPKTIMSAPRNKMSACLRGLFDTDGHVFVDHGRGGTTISVNFTNTSKELVEQIQYILLHYGIISTVTHRKRNKKWNTVYELGIYGKNVQIFADEIGFGLKRKQDKLFTAISQKIRNSSQNDNIPNIKPLLLYICKYYKGSGFPEVNYSKINKRKNISYNLVAKFLLKYSNINHKYIEIIKNLANPNIYYDTVKNIKDIGKCDTYDLHVPMIHEYCANGFYSHNSKIRGQRANDIIADEFAAQSQEVFENVIAGFGVVTSSPATSVQQAAAKEMSEKLGYDIQEESQINATNQVILSGTAYYDFNHFADYWKRWRNIIRSKGDIEKLNRTVFGNDEKGIPPNFNWRDYSIIRLPYELIPRGFMDEAMVARSKATIHSGIYSMEFGAVFSTDSNGFFKRSLIESCVLGNSNEIVLPSGKVEFTAMLKGRHDKKYVYGIDPASEVDNFSIIVLEHNLDHRKIVYAWTTNRKEHQERIKRGLSKETDFYSYCGRKIRELMKVFPCARMAIDSQGGGVAVIEALHDLDKINTEEGEVQIWPIINPDKPDPNTDGEPGLHIIEKINFASLDWTSEANHGLRKDFEDKVCIFPFFDSVSLGLAKIADEHGDRLYDTLEDCLMEIEELKNELSTIVITPTLTGKDRWDTPEVKLPGNKKGRLRKDRYSALLMANMVSRQMARNPEKYFTTAVGGWAGSAKAAGDKREYVGADWMARGLSGIYD